MKHEMEEFDFELYKRTSENNMPNGMRFVALSEEEQSEIDEALAL